MDETTLTLLKVIEDKYISVKEFSNRLEGFYTCTGVLLENVNSNLIEGKVSGVGDNFGSYEIVVDKLVRRIDLLESNLNQYFNKWFVFVANSCLILNVIPKQAKPVLVISTNPWCVRDAIAFTLVVIKNRHYRSYKCRVGIFIEL